MYKIAGST
jgi:hypothetical protein